MNIDQYIIDAAPYLTMAQMADELGVMHSTISTKCERLGVVPIRIGEQQKAFIISHKHWSREQLAKSLNVCDDLVRQHCKALGLDIPLKLTEIKTERTTIAQRLRETWR